VEVPQPNTRLNVEVAKLQTFNKKVGKISEFLIAYQIFIRMRMRSNMLWDALDMNNFYFLFLLFSDFIGILFSFSFSFLLDDEEARDTAVT